MRNEKWIDLPRIFRLGSIHFSFLITHFSFLIPEEMRNELVESATPGEELVGRTF